MSGRIWLTFVLVFATCRAIQSGSPEFHLQRVVFIDSATDGFDFYHLRANNIFNKGDHLSLYLEPVNCTIKKTVHGFKARLSAVATLQSLTNPALSQELQIGNLEFIFPKKETGLYADINLLDVGMLPVDLYQLKMTLNDVGTRQSVEFTRKFRVGPSYVEALLAASDSVSYSDNLKSQSEFSRETEQIFCLFHTRRIPQNSVLKSVFYAESVNGLEADYLLETATTPAERYQTGKIMLENSEGRWGIGNYRVELFINEEFEVVLYFRIL